VRICDGVHCDDVEDWMQYMISDPVSAVAAESAVTYALNVSVVCARVRGANSASDKTTVATADAAAIAIFFNITIFLFLTWF
jgi:hypothetical protein